MGKHVDFLTSRADLKDKITPNSHEDKIACSSSTTTKLTEKGQEKEAKETKDKDKTNDSNKEEAWSKTETKTTTYQVAQERRDALALFDANWHPKMSSFLATVAYELGQCVQLVQYNTEKILDPRGTGVGGKEKKGSMYY